MIEERIIRRSDGPETPRHLDPSPAHVQMDAISRALRNERWVAARRHAARALEDGLPATLLRKEFAAAGKSELLVRLLWRHRDLVFNNLGTVALFARLAGKTEDADEYFSKLRQWTPSDAGQHLGFCHRDYLLAYETLDERALYDLFRLKYRAWEIVSSDDVLGIAAKHADSFDVAPSVAEFFYRHRCDTEMEFPTWLREFKIAQLVHHLFSDVRIIKRFSNNPDPEIRAEAMHFCRMASVDKYANLEEARRIFRSINRSNGLLVSTFHGGFVRLVTFFYASFGADSHWLTSNDNGPNVIGARNNERAAAFRAYRALSEGQAVLVAPDGPHFGRSASVTVEVLGLRTQISQGAAALAYEANCDTGWLAAIRRESMFVPQYIPGPRRQNGETYGTFRDRWLSFYADRIQCALSSRPENLVPVGRWAVPYSKIWY